MEDQIKQCNKMSHEIELGDYPEDDVFIWGSTELFHEMNQDELDKELERQQHQWQ